MHNGHRKPARLHSKPVEPVWTSPLPGDWTCTWRGIVPTQLHTKYPRKNTNWCGYYRCSCEIWTNKLIRTQELRFTWRWIQIKSISSRFIAATAVRILGFCWFGYFSRSIVLFCNRGFDLIYGFWLSFSFLANLCYVWFNWSFSVNGGNVLLMVALFVLCFLWVWCFI